jgi:hypothetical protein
MTELKPGETTRGMRRMLLLAGILVVIIGIPVYLFPKNTARRLRLPF